MCFGCMVSTVGRARLSSGVLLLGLAIACGGAPRSVAPAEPAATSVAVPPAVASEGAAEPSASDEWDARLADPRERVLFVKEATRRYEDALVRREAGPVVDRFVEPLTRLYVEHHGDLDDETRVALIRLLADFRDARTSRALKKALEEFARKPTGSRDAPDVKWAARAVGELRLEAAAAALLAACMKLRASTPLGGITYRDCNEAMVAMPQKAWTVPLIAALKTTLPRPASAKDVSRIDAYRDELYRQTTAAQVLGELHAPEAVGPLTQVMLDREKADVHATALLALVKIGKPAVKRASELSKDPRHVGTAAIILGTIGRPEAEAPLIAASKTRTNAVDRAIAARELTKLPRSSASTAAFCTAFESIPLTTTVPPGMNALEMLSESAAQLYDPGLIDWLLERGQKTKGPKADLAGVRATIAIAVLKLARPEQLAKAKTAVDRWGAKRERSLYDQTRVLLGRCKTSASCYVGELARPENQVQANQFMGIKAAHMAAILGNATTRGEIVQRLPAVTNAAVRFAAAQAIDHLAPNGASDTAAHLRKIIEQNARSRDRHFIHADAPLRQVLYRIETRAD